MSDSHSPSSLRCTTLLLVSDVYRESDRHSFLFLVCRAAFVERLPHSKAECVQCWVQGPLYQPQHEQGEAHVLLSEACLSWLSEARLSWLSEARLSWLSEAHVLVERGICLFQ